ncbi:ZFY16 protein, partial [Galbula dea]|nr:ZFY16 protein [Galbula dea]
MESYFKAAVCDLDKLLDEFEQSTDEYDCYRAPQNPYDSKHHSLSVVLDCIQHVYPTPLQQEDANNFTSSEETCLPSHTATGEALLRYSSQNEKSIAGPDLLSMVDSGSLNEIQASNLGRCSIPVCDLVNDTGNLIHSVATHQDAEKLQPDDLHFSEGLIRFGISCIPVPSCVSPAECSRVSSTEQSDGDSMLQDSGHLKTEEINHLALKLDSNAATRISDPCDDQHRTESLKGREVLDHPELTAHLSTPCVPVTSQNLNAYSPKEEKAYEKLPCEPQDESAYSTVNKEMHERNVVEELDSKDESNAESMPSDLRKRPQLHKSHAMLPGNCVLPGSSCQTEAEVGLEKSVTEENVGSEELNSDEILNTVPSSCVATEDVQTSLSCLPLPVSICGSLVVTEEEVNALPQNEMAEVISDILTVHAGKSNTDLSSVESCENTDFHEQEEYIAEINESIVEKSADGEKYDSENVIDDSDSQQIKAFTSAFLDFEAEPYDVGVDSYYNEGMSPVMADFTFEENVIKCDNLISDAELDDFLYGQSLQSCVLKSSDNYNNLMEADGDEGNITNTNNLASTDITEEHVQAKLEGIKSINSNLEVSVTNNESESATEDSMSHVQDMTESGSEAVVSNLCSEGARPKQLLCISQGARGQRQMNRTGVLEEEKQEASSVTPETHLSSTSVSVSKNSDPMHSGESSSKAGGNQTSENAESLKIPATLSWKQPLWVPDSEAPNCMNCQVKFTFTRRRHHCRACGKVFCGGCCKQKCKLQYMEKEARVCTGCYNHINKAQAFEKIMSSADPVPSSSTSTEGSAAAPPMEETQAPGDQSLHLRGQKRVWFADGVLPGGQRVDIRTLPSAADSSSQNVSPVNPDLICLMPHHTYTVGYTKSNIFFVIDHVPSIEVVELDEKSPEKWFKFAVERFDKAADPEENYTLTNRNRSLVEVIDSGSDSPVSCSDYRALCGVENCVRNAVSLVPDVGLPPLLLEVGEEGKDPVVEQDPSLQQVIMLLRERDPYPLTFILNANLLVNVKLITYSSEKCWYFSTNGLHGLGQAEIIILLQCLAEEKIFPGELLKLFIAIYKDAMNGRLIRNMGSIIFSENFLPNEEHGGIVFVSPTLQNFDDEFLPDKPILYGILIHKLEVPWARVFPLRLILRFGAESDGYPAAVVNLRQRKALFSQIGHTIMESLADFSSYQYTLHTIENLFVHLETGGSSIKIPRRRYNEVNKTI